MNRRESLLVMALASATLTACASSRNLVVVLPEADGHVGAVVVQAGGSKTVLNAAYAADHLPPGHQRLATADARTVERIFGEALASLPRAPVDFTFHFASNSTELDAAAMKELDGVIAEIAQRKAAEVVITGHTDTVGGDEDNEALSRARAETVRDRLAPVLTSHGVPPESVSVAGRGKREPLPGHERDNTEDPLNRRVVITVR